MLVLSSYDVTHQFQLTIQFSPSVSDAAFTTLAIAF